MSTDVERRPWPADPRYLVGEDGSIVGPQGRALAGVLRSGYHTISIRQGGRSRLHSAHVMVCETFHGPRPVVPGVRIEAAHENGKKLDNRAVNLRWDTAKGNNQDRVLHGVMPFGERSGTAKLTAENVRAIRDAVASGMSCRALARRYRVSSTNISFIARRKTWRHVA